MENQSNISYRTVIVAPLPTMQIVEDINGFRKEEVVIRNQFLPIDYIGSKSVKSSSTVISQPMQSGDTMSDHMYRNPTTISISGTFALNGRNWDNATYDNIVFLQDRLTAVQTVFEYIKNNGVLCTIITIACDMSGADVASYDEYGNFIGNMNSENTRFLTRDNMALTSITWTEIGNTLDFSFEFLEVISIDMMEYEEQNHNSPGTGMLCLWK